MVAVTSKHSNIVQDLATLRLLSKLVPDVCGAATPEAVQDKVFDLMFALDEIITSGGYKESITVRQVHKFLEMNSHDEMLAKMIKKEKETDARVRPGRWWYLVVNCTRGSLFCGCFGCGLCCS